MKRAALLCALLVLATAAPASVRAAESRPLPDNVLALVEVANPTECEQKLRDLVWRLAPGAPVGPFQHELARMARTEDPSVLDLGAPLQWVMLQGEAPGRPIFVFGVVDAERYLDALPPNVYGGEADGNLRLYQEDPPEAVGEGVWDAGAARPLAIAVLDGRIVLGHSAEGVRTVSALVEQGPLSGGLFFEGADAGGVVRLRQVLAVLAEQGMSPFSLARDRVAGMFMAMPPGGMGGAFPRVMEVYVAAAEHLAGQMEVVTGTVSLTPDALVCTAGVQAVEGSGLAGYLGAMQGGGQELLACVPAGSSAAFAGRVGDLRPLVDWYMKLLAATGPQDGSGDEALGRIKERTAEALALMDGRFANAVGISPEGSLVSAKAFGVTDAARAEEFFNDYGVVIEDVAALQTGGGVPFAMHVTARPGAFTHAGRPITEWSYEFEFQAPEGTMPYVQQAAAMQEELMKAMFGSEMTSYSAIREDVFVACQGVGSLDALKAVLDGSVVPVTGEPRFVAAMADMPEPPAAVAYVALGELAGAYLRMMARAAQVSGMPMPPFFGNVRFEPAPAVGLAAAVDEAGALEARLVVPVEAITSIVDGFKRAFMSGVPGMMP